MNPLIPIILQLVATYGPTLASSIYRIVNTSMGPNGKPTDTMWARLIALENSSAASFAAALSKPPGT